MKNRNTIFSCGIENIFFNNIKHLFYEKKISFEQKKINK